jgi:hypothetical protein
LINFHAAELTLLSGMENSDWNAPKLTPEALDSRSFREWLHLLIGGASHLKRSLHRYTRSRTIIIRNARCFRTAAGIFFSKPSIGRTSAAGSNDHF